MTEAAQTTSTTATVDPIKTAQRILRLFDTLPEEEKQYVLAKLEKKVSQ